MSFVQLPHLDVMVCTACQLRCVGCTNFMGGMPLHIWPTEPILRDIDDAAKVIRAEKVTILGGEPLLHKDLVTIIRRCRDTGLTGTVQVLTNGMLLDRLDANFWGAIDWLKISVYPGKTPEKNIALAIRKQVEYGFTLDYKNVSDDPFRAVHTRETRSPESAQQTYETCWYRTYTRKIEQGYFWRCCTSPTISQQLLGLDPSVDGIKLEGLTSQALQEFLDRPTYMQACTRCHGNMGPQMVPWTEERDRVKWLKLSSM